ncbi:hypothetical protein [Oceanisphaera sp. KMM 10153]|uniref:hypothetical protein n=1 Tax=Oceanisphaera submarina TaxID=3390193 RepID=UPI0039771663
MTSAEYLEQIDGFEAHYQHDCGYLREFLEHSPEGYAKLAAFIPLTSHREALSVEQFWIAKLAAMQVADCGSCLQLNVRMALENGVAPSLIQATINGGSKLAEPLKDIHDFATSVASYRLADPLLEARIHAQLDHGQRIELGACIASAFIFPTLQRALGYAKSCNLMEIEV